MIETLEEELNALEEVDERFIARDDIFHCLGRTLRAHTQIDMKEDIPREGH